MRLPIAILLALPASFLSTLVAATPSPIFNHEPLSPPVQEKSHWRILSNKLIDVIWGTSHPDSSSRRPERQTVLSSSDDVVLRFNVSSDAEIKALAEAAETLLLDVWEFSREWVDIRLSADIVHPLLGLLPKSLQHAHTPLLREKELAKAIHDTFPTSLEEVQARIFDRKASFNPSRSAANGPENNIFFADYQPLSVIGPWMRLLSTLFSSHVTLIDIGRSHEDRPIHALRVGLHATNDKVKDPPKRKTVLVTGGLHAREWIGVSTVNYIAYSLITGYGKTPSITRLLEEFDFVFVPTVNPDGYVYTWETDRLWRKNRQETGNRFCQGIDLDRAFSFKWDGLTTTVGNPCSESFAGETPFEAVESRQLADWARNQTDQNNVEFVGFLDLHSYSQEILFPYSYSCDATPPGLENLQELAFGLEKAIRVTHGHTYEVMPACEGNVAFSSSNKKTRFGPRMEAAGGSALDYFYHEVGVKYAYQIKLRDRGNYGFLLPSENIVPTGKEILEAVLYLGNFLNEAYNAVEDETKDTPQVDLRRR